MSVIISVIVVVLSEAIVYRSSECGAIHKGMVEVGFDWLKGSFLTIRQGKASAKVLWNITFRRRFFRFLS